MASLEAPQEVAEHLNAALLLYKREVLVYLLDQAQILIQSDQPNAAVMVAGAALEHLRRKAYEVLPAGHAQRIEVWRQLRNRVAHGRAQDVTLQQASEMINGIREALYNQITPASPHDLTDAISRVQGKFMFVPTSSEEFIARKREDLPLEER